MDSEYDVGLRSSSGGRECGGGRVAMAAVPAGGDTEGEERADDRGPRHSPAP